MGIAAAARDELARPRRRERLGGEHARRGDAIGARVAVRASRGGRGGCEGGPRGGEGGGEGEGASGAGGGGRRPCRHRVGPREPRRSRGRCPPRSTGSGRGIDRDMSRLTDAMARLESAVERKERERRRAKLLERGAQATSTSKSANVAAIHIPWGPTSPYGGRKGTSLHSASMPLAGAVPSSLIRAGGYGSVAAGAGRVRLGSGFGGIRGSARGNLKSAAGAVPVPESGGGVGRGVGSDAVAPAEREQAVRELRERREMIDSQTKRLEEVLAKIRAGEAKENNLAKNSPKPSTPPAKPSQQQQHRVTGVGESPPASLAAFSPISRFVYDSPAVGGISNPTENSGPPAASRKPKSPPGGRKLAAPSETDPVEESSAVVRAVLSKISAPRVTSTAKKERPAGLGLSILRRAAAADDELRARASGSPHARRASSLTLMSPLPRPPSRGRPRLPRSAQPRRRVSAPGERRRVRSASARLPRSRPPRRGRSPRRKEEAKKEEKMPAAPIWRVQRGVRQEANAGYNAAQKATAGGPRQGWGRPRRMRGGAQGGRDGRSASARNAASSSAAAPGASFGFGAEDRERSVVFVWSARVVVGVGGGE